MPNRKAATIQDVAYKAKVSISTVSHVLNKTRHVEKTTHERVLAAVDELGYRPNLFARGLRGARFKTIGLIISDIREEFFAELTKTIESAANGFGYLVTLCDSEEDPEKEARYLEILADRGVDGIVLAPVDKAAPIRLPRGRKIPVVLVDRRHESSGLDFVGLDNRRGMRDAVRHLVDLGRRRIGFVCHERSIATMDERATAFARSMEERGLADSAELLTIKSKSGNGKARIKRWLGGLPDLDAVICGNDNICYTVLEALDSAGLAVPRRVAVVSFDDPECFSLMRSPVTAIRQPTERMGSSALEILLSRIEGRGPETPVELALPARLVVRESCGSALRGGANG